MYDIVVIGAGVVGGLIARELSKYDLRVCLVEKAGDVAMGATKANSAIVHAGFDAKVGSMKARMNVRGSEMMESVARELGVKFDRNAAAATISSFCRTTATASPPRKCGINAYPPAGSWIG